MPLRNDLLNPISADSPAGQNLKYDPLYDKIKEARRQDDDIPTGGVWESTRKVADWPLTIKLIGDALATKTKDLQLVAWLVEAMLNREGIGGLCEGLELTKGMISTFWDGLYPEIEDGDLELRVAPLQWMGDRLGSAVRLSAITRGGFTSVEYQDSREIPTEEAAGSSYEAQQKRTARLEEGKVPPEKIEKDFQETTKQYYVDLEKTYDHTLEVLAQLGTLCDEKFGDVSPSFNRLKAVLEEVRQIVRILLARKREIEPDPVTAEAPKADSGSGDAAVATGSGPGVAIAAMPQNWNDAAARVVAAAKFMRMQFPYSPASYLMLRGLRWGELRAGGHKIDPKLLAAPPWETRQNLKRLALDGNWQELLEASETAMGMECGRGWLDVQRYLIKACSELEGYYEPVRLAVMAELKVLLADYPALPEMTLSDDSPAASSETITWLKKEFSADEAALDGSVAGCVALRTVEMAGLAVRSGKPEAGIELLNREISQEQSGRGRFLRRTQLAELCMAGGNEAIATSLLQAVTAEIEEKRLEEWESRETLARPLVLYHTCLTKTENYPDERERLYNWICRLNPLEAMKITR